MILRWDEEWNKFDIDVVHVLFNRFSIGDQRRGASETDFKLFSSRLDVDGGRIVVRDEEDSLVAIRR